MIIVDDGLALLALSGRLDRRLVPIGTVVVTTWSFHFRLVRAGRDDRVRGQLSGFEGLRPEMVARPPFERLGILDPRQLTGRAGVVAVRHRLNVMAAELIAAAIEHRAHVLLRAGNVGLRAGNVGRRWPAAFAAEGVNWSTAA